MQYLVTGGAGFIGSNTVDELVRRGHASPCSTIFQPGKRPIWKKSGSRSLSFAACYGSGGGGKSMPRAPIMCFISRHARLCRVR